MQLESTIEKLVQDYLTDPKLFLVSINISGNSGFRKIAITLDGDNGISIDACAEISRKVGSEMEESELLDSKYTLEVSSPGLDQPFSSERQYKKNIGRDVDIKLGDDKALQGKLVEVDTEGISIAEIVYKGKAKNYKNELTKVLFDTIDCTKVLISF